MTQNAHYAVTWRHDTGYRACWVTEKDEHVPIGPYRRTHVDAVLDCKLDAQKSGTPVSLIHPTPIREKSCET